MGTPFLGPDRDGSRGPALPIPGPKVSKLLDPGVPFLQPLEPHPCGSLSAKAREHPLDRDQDHRSCPRLGCQKPNSAEKEPEGARAKPPAATQRWGRSTRNRSGLPTRSAPGVGGQGRRLWVTWRPRWLPREGSEVELPGFSSCLSPLPIVWPRACDLTSPHLIYYHGHHHSTCLIGC